MRFLITGGAGFLGVALANHLVATGHHVRVLDDLSAGDPSRLDGRVLFSRGDVRNVPVLWNSTVAHSPHWLTITFSTLQIPSGKASRQRW